MNRLLIAVALVAAQGGFIYGLDSGMYDWSAALQTGIDQVLRV